MYFYGSFQKFSVVFQSSSEKLVREFFLRKDFTYENMFLILGYQTLKTAGFYLLAMESYSKNIRLP
jgi:hypothetical protein